MAYTEDRENEVRLPKKPIFNIESDVNDINLSQEDERRIVPVPKTVTITNPSPAGE